MEATGSVTMQAATDSKPTDSRFPNIVFTAGFFSSSAYALHSWQLLWRGWEHGVPHALPLFGTTLLALVSSIGVVHGASMFIQCWTQSLTRAAKADRAFVFLAVYPTSFNLLATLCVPGFRSAAHAWPAYLAWLMGTGVLSDLTPGHSLLQLLITFPIMAFLDLYRKCHQVPSAQSSSCSFSNAPAHAAGQVMQPLHTATCMAEQDDNCWGPASFLRHLSTQGLAILSCGLAIGSICHIILIKHRRSLEVKPGNHRHLEESEQAWAQTLPLETLGTNLIHLVGLQPLLHRYADLVTWAAGFAEQTALVWVTCIPLGGYYLARTLVSRALKFASISSITTDEWLMVMTVFFMLGRSSNDSALVSLMHQVRGRVKSAYEIMSDMLPAHVVEYLMSSAEQSSHQNLEPEGQDANCMAQQLPTSLEEGDGPSNCGSTDTASSATINAGGELLRISRHGQNEAGRERQTPRSLTMPNLDVGGNRQHPLQWSPRASRQKNAADAFLPRGVDGTDNASEGRCSDSQYPSTGVPDLSSSLLRKLNVAECHDCVTVFFSDIVDFSTWARDLSPHQVMCTLNDLYIRLDDILLKEMPSLYKVETIGDAYMVAANLVAPDPQHAATMVRFALRAREEAAKVPRPDMSDGTTLQLRIGLHSGPAMSGTVGKIRRRFCMFGDTINMASRTETSCPPGCIQLTAVTQALAAPFLPQHEVVLQDRGLVEVKGAAQPMHMFLAEGGCLAAEVRSEAA